MLKLPYRDGNKAIPQPEEIILIALAVNENDLSKRDLARDICLYLGEYMLSNNLIIGNVNEHALRNGNNSCADDSRVIMFNSIDELFPKEQKD
ncbi:hypothetical protein M2459_001385 [Parabacteroides sp. PF5-5]|nr:hypothetical protein [Parabacteroides sp. PH5-39]MDH6315737.1 hypothetical protein [Parabacteroides sp. PF5-13]MDH6319397.1 hypothetical protein [Parabacteroides sp. PH5-13]MDH6323128.1 hypothetical protein [Parabacteroides sp. PH5-8]MDH6326930.1 hypothetical protein [Parabacteroides sp. PH5-41]MDH6334641.1 hypothetical protein [Parabacteroides sp. PF5-5]MDH6345705.1 hypothetical protein [Parabacteroides sp. PH5-46]MDH6360661.1 hypothetical protein [Parabacteroides sp. PH5-16]MDH6376417.